MGNESRGCDSGVLSISFDVPPTADETVKLTSKLKNEEGGGNSQHETHDTSGIYYGAAIGAVLALTGACFFANKRRRDSSGGDSGDSEPWLKTVDSQDNTESSSLTSLANQTRQNHGSSRNIPFGDNSILSVESLGAGTPAGPESTRPVFPDKVSTPTMAPISPVNSLFSVSSSRSKRTYRIEDTVDL